MMTISSLLSDIFFTAHNLIGWREALEIISFSAIIYYFSVWLKKDQHNNLLGYFYAYCLLTATTYTLDLVSLTHMLCLAAPVALLIFIMVHQQTLQKNFVTLRTFSPAQKENSDWLDAVIRSCLIAINKNKEVICIIEHHDSLRDHLSTAIPLQATIKEDLLTLIIESQTFDQQRLLWINSQGTLLGFNAQWNIGIDEQWIAQEAKEIAPFKQDALFATAKTDAVLIHISPTTRLFTIIMKGKIFEQVSAGNAVPFIKKYLSCPQSLQGESYASQQNNKKSTIQQHRS